MIVGNGLIANAFSTRFANDPSVLVYAAGVSDSTCRDVTSFERERSLLEASIALPVERRVYFSSCALGDSRSDRTPYLRHKQQMEELVRAAGGTVFRLPQVVGRTGNPRTLTNFLYENIVNGRRFIVWKDAERNLIDIDDVVAIGTEMIRGASAGQEPVSIAAPASIPMLAIVQAFERILGMKADYQLEDRGDTLSIDTALAQQVATGLGIEMGPGYTEQIIRKYYGRT